MNDAAIKVVPHESVLYAAIQVKYNCVIHIPFIVLYFVCDDDIDPSRFKLFIYPYSPEFAHVHQGPLLLIWISFIIPSMNKYYIILFGNG